MPFRPIPVVPVYHPGRWWRSLLLSLSAALIGTAAASCVTRGMIDADWDIEIRRNGHPTSGPNPQASPKE